MTLRGRLKRRPHFIADKRLEIRRSTVDLKKRLGATVFLLILMPIILMSGLVRFIPELRPVAVPMLLSVSAAMMFTALVLIGWLYQSIIKPLDVLRTATQKIKDGDLDFTIEGSQDDELGQLCDDFEEMRKHLKELIEVRMQYEKDTAELIGNISHDLKTPLTTIKGYAEGIMDGVADSEEKREKYIKTIYSKACDMSALVDELALYTKLDFNTMPYNFEIVDLNGYFDACVEDISFDLEMQNIRLDYENSIRGTEAPVIADREQLKRVINNLVGNSVKYMDKENGIVKICIVKVKTYYRITISDNGMGIPEEDLPHIFERFYRADVSRNSRRGGTGLGLAIAKMIINEHEGRIWTESKVGEGTSMIFELPAWEEKSDEQAGNTEGTTSEKLEISLRRKKPNPKFTPKE